MPERPGIVDDGEPRHTRVHGRYQQYGLPPGTKSAGQPKQEVSNFHAVSVREG
jgi:hypothetical protein